LTNSRRREEGEHETCPLRDLSGERKKGQTEEKKAGTHTKLQGGKKRERKTKDQEKVERAPPTAEKDNEDGRLEITSEGGEKKRGGEGREPAAIGRQTKKEFKGRNV